MEILQSVSRNKIEIFWTFRNLFKSAHLSSMKAAALKNAKNATMCLALNVQWNSQSITAMLSVNSAMMRWHKSAPLSEYSEECSTEIKEEYFEFSGHKCTTETFEQCKDVQWKVCHDQPTKQGSTEYSVKLFFPNQTEFGLDSAACKINFFSKPKWNWFGKSEAFFGCNFSKPNWICFGKGYWI